MHRPSTRSIAALAVAAALIAIDLSPAEAQAAEPAPAVGQATAAGRAPSAKPGDAKALLVPVFPAEDSDLVFVEGEDAVSTNMAAEPTLNFGCSGNRALQLSRSGAGPAGAAYFAEYSIFVAKAGTYQLWYGGLPPGPKDEFAISLASPVDVSVDEAPAKRLYREDVHVVEQYAPAYYWMRAFSIELAPGTHIVRFEVSEKRRVDDHYVFYLDAFFLASRNAFTGGAVAGRPELLPKNPADQSIDRGFLTIDEYKAAVQANPGDIRAYVELSTVYSLAGDYVNALKTLSRAVVLAPRDPELRFLVAKNRIWRGDVAEGLKAYREYLALKTADRRGYEEAGKVAAWSGRYSESEAFYRDGLAAFPGDLSLTLNLGLTELWASDIKAAERSLSEAEKAALLDPDAALKLASIYRSNGYPDKAVALYEKAIAAFPDRLELYLRQSEAYAAMGDASKSESLNARIAAAFEPSARLSNALSTFVARRDLKSDRIKALEGRVAERPDDLRLREDLSRVYSWNGLRSKAAQALESILVVEFVRGLDESDAAAADLFLVGAQAAALRAEAEARQAAFVPVSADAQSAGAKAIAAETALADWNKRQAQAAAAGKPLPAAEGEVLAARTASAYEALAAPLGALRTASAAAAALAERAKALRGSFDSAADREKAADATFKKLVAGLGWTWAPKEAAGELAEIAKRGEPMASYAEARIMAATGESRAALVTLGALSTPALAERRKGAEFLVRSRSDYRSVRAAARAALEQGGSDLPALAAAARELGALAAVEAPPLPPPPESAGAEAGQGARPDAGQGAGDDGGRAAYRKALRDALRDAVSGQQEARKALADSLVDLSFMDQAATLLLGKRLERAWYAYEERAADRKAALGALYDGLGLSAKAASQYRRALAVDPTNLSVMYNLALADDRVGDWAGAERLLRKVYEADPGYERVAAIYNGVARRHAMVFDSSGSVGADLNRLSYKARSSVLYPAASAFSLAPAIELASVRDWSQGAPAYLSAALELGAPLAVGNEGLVLRPSASIVGTTMSYDQGGVSTFSPSAFAGSLRLMTAGGAGIDWRAGVWSGQADYRWGPLADTVNPVYDPLYSHKVELSAGGYYSSSGPFRYFAPRLYALGYYVPDERNLFGTCLVELVPALKLVDAPWSNLGFPVALAIEHSADPKSVPYYAADGALTTKGGLRLQSVFSRGGGDAVALTVQGLAGLYQTGSFSASPAKNLYLAAFLRLDLIRGETTYWLSAEATASDPTYKADPAYWSLTVAGGATLRQPRLLAP